jgi:hypothetical protein
MTLKGERWLSGGRRMSFIEEAMLTMDLGLLEEFIQ